jgi:peptide/nickel transport system ATP-binding protein
MYLGRIVEVGPTEDVLAQASHPYTKALLSVAGEGMAARTSRPVLLKGEPPDSTRIPSGCRFHPRCPALASGAAEAAGVADACRSTDLPIIPAATGHAAACHLVSAS